EFYAAAARDRDRLAAIDGHAVQMRLALIEEGRPVTHRRPIPDPRRHLRFASLLLALALVFPGFDIGPDAADEGDVLAIGEPLAAAGTGRNGRDPLRLATRQCDH